MAIKFEKNYDAQLSNITKQTSATDTTNTFTLDLSQRKNFTVTIADANSKTIAFSNIPADLDFASPVTVKLVCTGGNTIGTYPAGVVWQDGVAPILNITKTYYLTFIRTETGWHGMWAGEF
jgi:hypothetical protein